MKRLLTIIGLLLLVSCNHTSYYSSVRSQSVGDVSNKSYFIMPFYKDVNAEGLDFINNSKPVRHILNKSGMNEVERKEAEIAIMYGYGIRAKDKIGTYTTYDTVKSTSTTTSSDYGTFNTDTTISVPKTNVYTYTEYTRRAIISFIDYKHFKKTKKMKELSKLEIFSTGSSSDLNAILKVVIRTALPYVGGNRSGNVKIVWDNDGKKFIKVKGNYISEEVEKEILTFMNQEWLNIDITD